MHCWTRKTGALPENCVSAKEVSRSKQKASANLTVKRTRRRSGVKNGTLLDFCTLAAKNPERVRCGDVRADLASSCELNTWRDLHQPRPLGRAHCAPPLVGVDGVGVSESNKAASKQDGFSLSILFLFDGLLTKVHAPHYLPTKGHHTIEWENRRIGLRRKKLRSHSSENTSANL